MGTQIKIKTLWRPDKSSYLTINRKYRVILGNGLTIAFTQEVKAKAFLAQTNRFLNDRVIEINMIYIEIWTQYRRLYIVFFDLLDSDKFRTYNAEIDKRLTMMIRRSDWYTGNVFTFRWFDQILTLLQEFAQMVHNVLKEKKRNYNTFEMYVLLERLSIIHKQINSWGTDLPGGFNTRNDKDQENDQ